MDIPFVVPVSELLASFSFERPVRFSVDRDERVLVREREGDDAIPNAESGRVKSRVESRSEDLGREL